MKKFNLKTGDVITASGEDFGAVEHVGIYYVDYKGVERVAHNIPGSGVTVDTFLDFVTKRKPVSVESTGVGLDTILRRISELSERKYNVLTFNCYHFVELVTK